MKKQWKKGRPERVGFYKMRDPILGGTVTKMIVFTNPVTFELTCFPVDDFEEEFMKTVPVLDTAKHLEWKFISGFGEKVNENS